MANTETENVIVVPNEKQNVLREMEVIAKNLRFQLGTMELEHQMKKTALMDRAIKAQEAYENSIKEISRLLGVDTKTANWQFDSEKMTFTQVP